MYSVEVLLKNADNTYTRNYVGKDSSVFYSVVTDGFELQDSGSEIERQDLTEKHGFDTKEEAEVVAARLNTRGVAVQSNEEPASHIVSVSVL